jgi:hypothetical protein
MEGSYLEDPGLHGRIILKLITKRQVGVAWTELIWLVLGIDGGLL